MKFEFTREKAFGFGIYFGWAYKKEVAVLFMCWVFSVRFDFPECDDE